MIYNTFIYDQIFLQAALFAADAEENILPVGSSEKEKAFGIQ